MCIGQKSPPPEKNNTEAIVILVLLVYINIFASVKQNIDKILIKQLL